MTAEAGEVDFGAEPSAATTGRLVERPRRAAHPGATYRLQLRGANGAAEAPEADGEAPSAGDAGTNGFGFAEVRELLGYFAGLGVTHLYLSPIMRARSDSTHGYDVVDPTMVSPALGGEDALRELSAAAAERGIGLIIDIVPNHMAASEENPLWEQLLASGMSGPAGPLFDVDWRPALPTAEGKVVLPVLAEPYGQALAAGHLTLIRRAGTYRLQYRDRTFPLRVETLDVIEGAGGGRAFLGTPGVAASWAPLHDLLEQQHYRLVHWRIGDRVINYRRFFTINDLVAVRADVPEVFELCHAKLVDLIADGVIAGLRVDHPDGLRDPERYLQQLRSRTGAWIVAEKILHPGEQLPDWQVAGTTGYDFCNDVLGLYVDPAGLPALQELDGELGGGRAYQEHAVEAKGEVLHRGLAADLHRLAARLWAVTQQSPEARDVTFEWCRQVLSRTLEHFGVYRSYVDPETGAARPADREQISQAIARARAGSAEPPAELWDFLERLLCGDAGSTPAMLEVIASFQQLCTAVTAKGTEDTAFYRYRPLLAVAEVGGDPARPDRTVAEFQQANGLRAERHPAAMLSTATHDSKRGEDVRLRMAALSEVPQAWRSAVEACEALEVASDLPAQARLLVYQTMVGLWPVQGDPGDDHRDRLARYVVKAEREAGLFTNWVTPDEEFEARLQAFARELFDSGRVPSAFADLVRTTSEIGMVSSLGQVVLRCLSPGVPDVYQGTELWDDSLVDPDNRRPVAFDVRGQLLDSLAGDVAVDELLDQRRDGRIKLFVLQRSLAARADHPSCVGVGSGYLPLDVVGERADHVVAFARVASDGSDALLVVAPRLPGAVMNGGDAPPVGAMWGDTTLRVPGFVQGDYRDVFSGAGGAVGETIAVAELLDSLPVAMLERT